MVLSNKPEAEGLEWACRSLDVAAECGATACALIPTRGGNGALEALGADYHSPSLRSLETAMEYGLSLQGLRVFADLWDVEKFFTCACSPLRAERLALMNRTQAALDAVVCAASCKS